MTQVAKESYTALRYAQLERFGSYWHQTRELLATDPTSILEVGIGDGVVADYIRRHTTIAYTTADYAADLSPDVVADIRKLPFPDASFDTVCAFEVLEHLPFEEFDAGFGELVRVAKNAVVISLPHFGPPVKLLLKLPLLPELKLAFKIPYPRAHVFNGQHHWEIGKRGYPSARIRAKIARHGAISREFVPFENQYHHFFVLEKKL